MKGQNMIQTLARKRTNAVALAVLAALVAALFVAIQSAHAAPAIAVEFSDSDGIVADGTTVRVYVRDASTGDDTTSGYTVTAVTVSGELAGTELPGVTITSGAILAKTGAPQSTTNQALSITIPKGTAPGDYIVTATATQADEPDLVDSATLTVGEPGKGVGSVEISFNKSHIATANAATGTRTCGPAPAAANPADPSAEDAAQTKSERTDDASAPADEPICLTATVKNSLGATANMSDIKLLFIIAEGGTITGNADGDVPATGGAVIEASRTPKYNFSVTRSTAGPVAVEVDAGPADASLELMFTGAAEALSIGDASDVLARSGDAYTAAVPDDTTTADVDESADAVEGGVIFEVMASDKAGKNVDLAPGDVTAVKITDADDKDVTSKFNTDNEMQKANNPQVVLVRVGTGASKVDAGEYTVSVSLTEVVDSAVTSTFRVADVPANVELSASSMTSDTIGDVITVTATVTDENGNTVADGTDVDFDVSSSTGLAGIGKGHGADDTVDTKAGVASVKYAVVGAGNSVVSATAGGATGVVVIVSTAGTADAGPQEVSLDCLSQLTGFSSYTCSMGSSASELFGLLSGRGATAIHLWNGSAWVRYAVVDGNEIPGSTDFMVTEDDILYISN